MTKETSDSLIVSEIFPVRPHGENALEGEGRAPLRLEAYAMIELLGRAVGKQPRGVRFSLFAGHEKLVCFFYGDEIDHWQYVAEVEKNWPQTWDKRAKIVLGIKDDAPVEIDKETKLLTAGVINHAKRGNLRHKSSSRTVGNRSANGQTPEAGRNADHGRTNRGGLPI